MWEVSWRPNKDCNILTPPQLFWLSQPFFPVLLGCSTGGPTSAGTWFSFQHLLSNWLWISCRRGNIIIWCPPTSCERHNSHLIQPLDSQGRPWFPDIFDRMHLLFTRAFLLLTAWPGRRSICNNIYYIYRERNYRFYCIWLVQFLYIFISLIRFLESEAFVGEASVLWEISFLILWSLVWTSDLFSLQTLKTSIFIEDFPGNKHSQLVNHSLIILYTFPTLWLANQSNLIIYVYGKNIPSTYQIWIGHAIKPHYWGFVNYETQHTSCGGNISFLIIKTKIKDLNF